MSVHYYHKKALDCMVANVPVMSPKLTVGEATKELLTHAAKYASIAYIYLASADRVLVGVVSIKELCSHTPHTLLAVVSKAPVVYAAATDSAESIALLAVDHQLKAVPIVDTASKRLVGVVTSDTVMDILHSGRTRDALRRAGTKSFDDPKNSLLSGTPLVHIKKRLPWLLLGLGGGLVAAEIVQNFESALAAHVLIVAFIPLVVYLADAVGSQTEIIFVRAIALDPKLALLTRFKTYFARELVVSGVLALILAFLMALLTTWWFEAAYLVPLLATAIVATLMLSMVVALVIPFLATKLNYDPALTSGPVATVIRDVLTLVVYFWIVGLFL
jgi:magnesium transporter